MALRNRSPVFISFRILPADPSSPLTTTATTTTTTIIVNMCSPIIAVTVPPRWVACMQGETPLHFASHQGLADIAKSLLTHGAQANAATNEQVDVLFE